MDSKLKKELSTKNKKDSAKSKQKEPQKAARTIAQEQLADEEYDNEREGKSELSSREIFDRSRNVASQYKDESDSGNFTTAKSTSDKGFFGDSYFGKEQDDPEAEKGNLETDNVSDSSDVFSDFFADISSFDKKMQVLDIKCDEKNRKYGRMDSADKAEKAKDYNFLSTSIKKIKLCQKVARRMDMYSQNSSMSGDANITSVRNKYDKIRFRQDQINFSIRRKHIEETPNGIADEVYKKLRSYADDEVNAYKGYSLGKSEMDVDI